MSKLCLGTVQFGMKYGVNNALGRQPYKQECYGIISEALKAGIVFFDTASVYGSAEKLLGEFAWGRYCPKIISKLPPTDNEDASTVVIEIQKSLNRLRQEKIYGYMLHRASDLGREAIMSGMSIIKEQGFTEKIGVSVYEPEEAMQAVSDSRIDIIQIPYNVFDKRLDKAGFFIKAKEERKEIYARSAFLQGLLLMKPELAEARVPGSGQLITTFNVIASDYGYAPLEAAMLYNLYHKGIDYVVFGVDTIGQLQENLAIQARLNDFYGCFKTLADEFMDVPREILIPSLWR